VVTVKLDTTIKALSRLLVDHKISGAPVVDDDGLIIGIVTEHDLIRQNKRLHIPTVLRIFDAFFVLDQADLDEEVKKMAATTVRDICETNFTAIHEETRLDEIATIMSEKKIHLLPVVENRKLVGIIGKSDIVSALAR
jgi:CBS domain-containing protein